MGLKPGVLFKKILVDVDEKHKKYELKTREEALEYVKRIY